ADKLERFLVQRHRLLEIDDVNLVTVAEDIGRHPRVPVAGLVSEVDSRFEHFTHCDRHALPSPVRVEPPSAERPPACEDGWPPLRGGCAYLSFCAANCYGYEKLTSYFNTIK